ncbi:hypothetical protein PAXRUDRAFT_10180 [Paxillus rubicundulus Ve08.2h10]|uniref:Uncharacterized protein n=1 Tax=Paxillus rubicundulus Ve08.2h10 TaxID=930991 RepID=A0A0D0DH53_9AGAM|nr:hypothetical protein PAXRUDRAFT_10180 [Paxillus rubicundulus Ve08.2h10]
MDDASSVQRCLHITEIIAIIFGYVEKTGLAGLTRTSRLSQDVALDALYDELGTLESLMRSMTDDTLCRPLERSNLETSKSYAVRVRKLTVKVFEPRLYDEAARVLCVIPQMTIQPSLPISTYYTGR